MKNLFKNLVKTNPLIYDLYFYIGSMFIKFLGLFFKINNKSILFVSFGGKNYDDSPRVIYEAMIKDRRFSDYEYYWAFIDTNKFSIPKGKKIKIDSFKYYYIALSSRIWITNSAIERGLRFKKKNIYYINTWHGTPLKKIGKNEHSVSIRGGLGSKNVSTEDILLAQSRYDAKIFSDVFDIDISKILICDLPRNDYLTKFNEEDRKNIRSKLGIKDNNIVILYAPTYREYERNKKNNCYFKSPINFDKWKKKLGEEYTVLFRAHYEVVDILGVKETSFIKNVSSYPSLNELMIASDMLISDYSSIIFDYSILERPIFCYAYDLETYKNKRGLYLNLEENLPCKVSKTEDDLLNSILNINYEESVKEVKLFKEKYAPYSGEATKKVLNLIERGL